MKDQSQQHDLAQASEDFANMCHTLTHHEAMPGGVQAGQFNFQQFGANFLKLAKIAKPFLNIAAPLIPPPEGPLIIKLLELIPDHAPTEAGP